MSRRFKLDENLPRDVALFAEAGHDVETDCGFLDAGNDLELTAAAPANLDVDRKNPLEALRPGQRPACAVPPVSSIVWYRRVIWHLLPLKSVDEAEAQLQRGLATDPLNMALQHGVTQFHFYAGRFEQAVEHVQDMVALDASHANLLLLGYAQYRNGDLGGAVHSLTRVHELAPWWPMGIGWLAAFSHLAGDRARTEALGRSLPPSRDAATYHAAAGNADEMFAGLEVAWQRRDAFLTHILTDAVFAPYFDDSRFKSLLARMNLAV